MSFILVNMLNWLKSGKLSGESSKVKVSDEGGEEPRESEESEEIIATDAGEENEQESENDEPDETAKEGRRWQQGKRSEEGEHPTGEKKEGNRTKMIWVWASIGRDVQWATDLHKAAVTF